MTCEIINYPVNMLPDFILESQQFFSWRGLFPNENIFHIRSDLLLPDLNIKSQKHMNAILDCETQFVFTQKHRIIILKNIYKFWRENPNSSEIQLPKENMSQFGDQVRTLFKKPNNTYNIIMSCMKDAIEVYSSLEFDSKVLILLYLFHLILNCLEHI